MVANFVPYGTWNEATNARMSSARIPAGRSRSIPASLAPFADSLNLFLTRRRGSFDSLRTGFPSGTGRSVKGESHRYKRGKDAA